MRGRVRGEECGGRGEEGKESEGGREGGARGKEGEGKGEGECVFGVDRGECKAEVEVGREHVGWEGKGAEGRSR